MPWLVVVDPVISFSKGLLRFPLSSVPIKYNSLLAIVQDCTKNEPVWAMWPVGKIGNNIISVSAIGSGTDRGRIEDDSLLDEYRLPY